MNERKKEILKHCIPWIFIAVFATANNFYWLTFLFATAVYATFLALMYYEEDPRKQPVKVVYVKDRTTYVAAGNMYRVFDQPHLLDTGEASHPVYLSTFWAAKHNWVALRLSEWSTIEVFFKRTHQTALSRLVLAVLGFERYTIAGHVSTEPDSIAGFYDTTTASWNERFCAPFFVSYVTSCLHFNLAARGAQNETAE